MKRLFSNRRLVLALAFLVVAILYANYTRGFLTSWEVRRILKDAISVRIIEYRATDESGDPEVSATKVLTLKEARQVAGCFTPFALTPVAKCQFEPHHTFACKQADGREVLVEVCFKCRQLRIGGGPVLGMGRAWEENLQRVLPELGALKNAAL
ncbi:MAG TPA: hypothetical protein VK956_19485 [Verrucomicrobium sp.]|nr:hypothetical protein [Verrucomicrobium sp.]